MPSALTVFTVMHFYCKGLLTVKQTFKNESGKIELDLSFTVKHPSHCIVASTGLET